ncbi:PAS and ANTAR domain-containing protein [Nocardia sp. NPDC050406]|uniref:PAS and ANTAR domain-containing protein n=1 Tax=Nocardia sp. NPDC050406 TaxID=3364318 RepID=UPI003791C097
MPAPAPGETDGAPAAAQHQESVGGFRFWFVGQRWEWSDEVARMHGYEPGEVEPTTELLMSHKHPDDRAHVQDLLDYALHSGESFSSRHRFLDTSGAIHNVIVVADRMFDESGTVVGTSGYYIDLTDTLAETTQEILDETLPELFQARAVIEQAKGVLMLIYRINADQAFRVLRWRSQETNTKLRALATQLVAELDTIPSSAPATQSHFDHLLLTVHERIPSERPSRRAANGPDGRS